MALIWEEPYVRKLDHKTCVCAHELRLVMKLHNEVKV
jgi:hypothetical protein